LATYSGVTYAPLIPPPARNEVAAPSAEAGPGQGRGQARRSATAASQSRADPRHGAAPRSGVMPRTAPRTVLRQAGADRTGFARQPPQL